MAIDMEKVAVQAMREAIASQALAALDTEHRDTILKQAVTDAIKDWHFGNTIKDAVCQRASVLATDYLQTEEGSALIREAVLKAIDNVAAALVPGIQSAMYEALAGKNGTNSYDRSPGMLLRHLPKVQP